MNGDDEHAAPPDDGGHQGSFSRPRDELETGQTDPRPDADSEDGRHPPLHRDVPSHRSLGKRPMPLANLAWMVLILLLVLGMAYAWSFGRL